MHSNFSCIPCQSNQKLPFLSTINPPTQRLVQHGASSGFSTLSSAMLWYLNNVGRNETNDRRIAHCTWQLVAAFALTYPLTAADFCGLIFYSNWHFDIGMALLPQFSTNKTAGAFYFSISCVKSSYLRHIWLGAYIYIFYYVKNLFN